MIILNEKKEAAFILSDINSSECQIVQVINLLTRYYINEKNMSVEDASKSVKEFLNNTYGGYKSVDWTNYIENVALNAHKKPLRSLNSIPITQKEINEIKSIEDKRLQKLAFACLVVSKMNMLLYNHSWISVSDRDLFKLANLKHISRNDINLLIYKLYKLNFISFAKRVNNTSKKYEKIDMDGKQVINVSYLSDLGYWWKYINGEKFNICEECGRLYKPRSSNQRYCFIHSSTYNKPLVCTCIECGREFQIEPGKRKRKRCECCYMERRLSQVRDNVRNFKNKKKVIN